jgi:hypothetical protein
MIVMSGQDPTTVRAGNDPPDAAAGLLPQLPVPDIVFLPRHDIAVLDRIITDVHGPTVIRGEDQSAQDGPLTAKSMGLARLKVPPPQGPILTGDHREAPITGEGQADPTRVMALERVRRPLRIGDIGEPEGTFRTTGLIQDMAAIGE